MAAPAHASTRERLLALVRDRPGIHKSALCAASGLAWGTVDYHLRILVREGRMSVHQASREARCFPGGLPPRQKALLAALADGTGSRIALVLRHSPGQGIGALSERLGLSSKVLRLRLLRMVEEGMLERVGKHRPRYSLGEEAHGLFVELADRLRTREEEGADGAALEPFPELTASKTGK